MIQDSTAVHHPEHVPLQLPGPTISTDTAGSDGDGRSLHQPGGVGPTALRLGGQMPKSEHQLKHLTGPRDRGSTSLSSALECRSQPAPAANSLSKTNPPEARRGTSKNAPPGRTLNSGGLEKPLLPDPRIGSLHASRSRTRAARLVVRGACSTSWMAVVPRLPKAWASRCSPAHSIR